MNKAQEARMKRQAYKAELRREIQKMEAMIDKAYGILAHMESVDKMFREMLEEENPTGSDGVSCNR